MNVKNAIATGLLLFGLAISLTGFSLTSEDTMTQEIEGKEIVVKNSETQHFNWRVFLGSLTAILGVGLYAFPSAKDLEKERYGRA